MLGPNTWRCLVLLLAGCGGGSVRADTVTLPAARDTTLFQNEPDNSGGGGPALYAGTNGSLSPRRGLLYFDIAGALPSGATITGAELALTLAQVAGTGGGGGTGTPGQPRNIRLHAMTNNWGEGVEGTGHAVMQSGAGFPAQPGDATWNARFFPLTLWNSPGGNFVSTASASCVVSGTTVDLPFTWSSTPQMVADVQGWYANPASNFGWMLKNETEDVARTFYAFYSREWTGTANANPRLVITYTPAQQMTWRETWLRQYFSPVESYPGDSVSLTGDGLNNLLHYAFGLSPLVAYPPGTGLQTSVTASGGNHIQTITFRRDPRAVDLTYQLQASGDLVSWTPIVQSIGGGVPTGSAYVSEAEVPGDAPVRVVTAVETLPMPERRFVRLKVIRVE